MSRRLRFMIRFRRTASSLMLLALFVDAAAADDVQKTAEEMMERARQLSDIRSPNAPGFRMNVTFSFIGKDLETLQGTYTEVWMSNSQWRRETVVGDLRQIEIGGPASRWLVDDGKDLPEPATHIPTLVQMFPSRNTKFEFKSSWIPNSTKQCFLSKAVGEKHQRHAFCFDNDHHVLARSDSPQSVGDRVADYACDYNQFAKFGDYWFPRQMECRVNGHRQIEAKVVDLSPASSPDSGLFKPPDGALEMGVCPANPLSPKAISTPDPSVPRGMLERQVSVSIWMIVDINGKPQDLKVSRSGGKEFDRSALEAVRGWRFKPAICNGQPISAHINVEIRFSPHR
ncbi:MAG: energy transducer TonB [Terriglobales bacterium]|jgi:TonB family protein